VGRLFCFNERLKNCYLPTTFSVRLLRSLSAAISILDRASNANASRCNGDPMASRHGTPPNGWRCGEWYLLAVRLFIWLASTYAPQSVHGAELGIVLFSVTVTAAHIFVLKMAQKAN
jgi:hypothetical protein